MRALELLLVILAAAMAFPSTVASSQAQPASADCQQWEDCRERALEARERGEYERFHDLAWRAVQTGPRNHSALMYLLARAQALSGRRRDAFIMLRRLADMGVPTEAATEEDFRRTRELPGWVEIETRFERARTAAPVPAVEVVSRKEPPPSMAAAPVSAPPAPATAAPAVAPKPDPPSPPPPPAPVREPSALTVAPRAVVHVARFSTEVFSPAGLAYDGVSRRFLFGDMRGRRLFVVGESSGRTVDLVRQEAAGFHNVTALEIDSRRGDLWVASTAPDGDAAGIHKLQLISGRVLTTFAAPGGAAVSLTDLAVSPNGTLLILDSASGRVLRLRTGASSVESAMSLDIDRPVSLAVSEGERSAYVAYADGILRLDLQLRTAMPVTASTGVALGNFERLRWHRNALVGIQTLPDGSRGLVVLELNRAGNAVTAATVVDPAVGDAPAFLTLNGDEAYYSTFDKSGSADGSQIDVLVRRVPLR